MPYEPKFEIRDPIHGFIELSRSELRIVDSAPFQRLRRIHQLGTTYLVYPTAEHTRFTHSLGVMQMSTRIFDRLVHKHHTELNWTKQQIMKYRQMLRLTALLHDIGHAPFSHTSDSIFPADLNHEMMGAKIICETQIGDIVDEIGKPFDFGRQHIADMITQGLPEKDYRLLRDLLIGELDADKMDYLLRDSMSLRVEYGKFDLPRILQTLCLFPHERTWRLGVEEGGVQAVEGLVMARYYMFVQIYFHKTRRVYDKMMERFLQDLLPNNRKTLPDNVEEYLNWDDIRVLERAKEHPSPWGRRILNREHFVLAYQAPARRPLSSQETKRLKELLLDIEHTFGYNQVIADFASKTPIKFEHEEEPTIWVVTSNDDEPKPFQDVARIVSKIDEPILYARIYCERGLKNDVRKFSKRKFKMEWE
ncbi:HD domain-containing protein [Kyrpidia spormannii]|nr:HD domain-containing protein [Kyrpidia spormannii]